MHITLINREKIDFSEWVINLDGIEELVKEAFAEAVSNTIVSFPAYAHFAFDDSSDDPNFTEMDVDAICVGIPISGDESVGNQTEWAFTISGVVDYWIEGHIVEDKLLHDSVAHALSLKAKLLECVARIDAILPD